MAQKFHSDLKFLGSNNIEISGGIIDNLTGDLVIQNSVDDSDIIFKSDDINLGSGTPTEYFRLDGSTRKVEYSVPLHSTSSAHFEAESGVGIYGGGYGTFSISNNDDSYHTVFGYDGGAFSYIDGQIVLLDYGSGNETTGTAAYNLAVTSDGTLIEVSTVDDADTAKRIEVDVKNVFGATMTKGTVVHVQPTGTLSGNVIEVVKADANVAANMPAIAVLNEDLANNAEGKAVMFGTVQGIDTSSFSVGDELYVSTTAGEFTATKPTATTELVQKIAVVIKSHASNGLIKVFGAGRSNDVPNLVDRTIQFSANQKFTDNSLILLGGGDMFQIGHKATYSQIATYEGHLYIDNNATDQDIIFRSDDGSGGLAEYFRLDGSAGNVRFEKHARFTDNYQVQLGDSADLKIYHDGSNSYIQDAGTGSLIIQGDTSTQIKGGTYVFLRSLTNENMLVGNANGSVDLYYDNSKKFETTSSGIKVTSEGYQINIEDGSSGNISEILTSNTAMGFFADRANAVSGTSMIFSVDNTTALTIDDSQNATFTGTGEFAGAIRITETGTSQNILIGNQDSGGANKPAMIRGVNGHIRIGYGNSWSGEGGTFTSQMTFNANGVEVYGINDSQTNAFKVTRGSDGSEAFRVENSGEVIVSNNYFYAAGSGTSMYVQNTAVFRGNIVNDGTAGVVIGDDLTVNDTLFVSEFIRHTGDTGTHIQMLSNQMILRNNSGMYVNIHANNNIYYNANEHIFYNGITSQGHIVPSIDSTYDLGATSLYWRNLYVDNIISDGGNSEVQKVYKDTVTINNSTYTTIATVAGDSLASGVRLNVTGTSGSVVINVDAKILVQHSRDILIQSTSGYYRRIFIKVISDNNEDFAIQLKRDTSGSTSTTSVNVEIIPLSTEVITFTSSHSFTGQSHEHITEYGQSQSSVDGDNANDFHFWLKDDGAKLKLGGSSDLELYHDGSHSYIRDNGTGRMRFMASTQYDFLNGAGTETLANFIENGAVQLYYDNSQKFATYTSGTSTSGNHAISSGSKLMLRGTSDNNHYVRYASSGFSGVTIDGPQVVGHQGGELGTNIGSDNYSLRWNSGGDVFVRNGLTVYGGFFLDGITGGHFENYQWGVKLDISEITSGGWARAYQIETSDSSGSFNMGVLGSNTTTTYGFLSFGAAGDTAYNSSNAIKLTKAGKVGIKIASNGSPDTTLHINGNATDGWIKLSTTSGNPYITSTNNLEFYVGNSNSILYLENGTTTVGINKSSGLNAGGFGSPKLVIKQDANSDWGGINIEASGNDAVFGISTTDSAHMLAGSYRSSAGYKPIQFKTSNVVALTINTDQTAVFSDDIYTDHIIPNTSNAYAIGTTSTYYNDVISRHFSTTSAVDRTKIRLWGGSTYGLGMANGFTYGHITDEYCLTFQMNNNNGRGFWWGDDGHSGAQGAMSLTTTGRLTVATSLSVGEGESITSPSTVALYANGAGTANAATLKINNQSSSAYNHSIEAFAPNMTSTETNVILVGVAGSTKNSGYIGYKYSSSGSDSNILTLGHWASDHLLNIKGNGHVGIGEQDPLTKLHITDSVSTGINLYSTYNYSLNRNWRLQLNAFGSGNWGGIFYYNLRLMEVPHLFIDLVSIDQEMWV